MVQVTIDPPNTADTVSILRGLRARLERHHGVREGFLVLKLSFLACVKRSALFEEHHRVSNCCLLLKLPFSLHVSNVMLGLKSILG
jgi:hypothetical protein